MSPLPGGRWHCVIPHVLWVPIAMKLVANCCIQLHTSLNDTCSSTALCVLGQSVLHTQTQYGLLAPLAHSTVQVEVAVPYFSMGILGLCRLLNVAVVASILSLSIQWTRVGYMMHAKPVWIHVHTPWFSGTDWLSLMIFSTQRLRHCWRIVVNVVYLAANKSVLIISRLQYFFHASETLLIFMVVCILL